MSIECMSRVWNESKHKGAALLALLSLADHANDDGVCWPGIKRLAQRARTQSRHATRLINALVESGELYAERGEGRSHSNLYFVCLGLGDVEILRVLMSRDWFYLSPIEARGVLSAIRERQSNYAHQTEEVDEEAEQINHDTQDSIYGKDDTQDTKPVTQGTNPDISSIKPVTQGRKADIAVSSEPSLTIIKPSIEPSEPRDFQESEKMIQSPDGYEEAKILCLDAMNELALNGQTEACQELYRRFPDLTIWKKARDQIIARRWKRPYETAAFKHFAIMVERLAIAQRA